MLDGEILPPNPSLEAQIADVADDLTYYGHDVDDGLDSGLLTLEMLAPLKIWQMAAESAEAKGLHPVGERFSAFTVRCLIDLMVRDVIQTSSRSIDNAGLKRAEDVFNLPGKLISFSPEYKIITDELRDFLYHNLYFNPGLGKLNEMSYKKMRRMFKYYAGNPLKMGDTARRRIARVGVERAAADYIAGMTDRFAAKEYQRISRSAREI